MYTTSLFSIMDELFEQAHPQSFHSKAELRKTDKGFAADILLPGFTKEEVNVKVEGDDLIIEAKTERSLPKFLSKHVKRTYQVEDINPDNVSAKLECGILNLEFSTAKKTSTKTISVI